MIQVDDLHKAFGRVTAIDGLSFRVGEGEIVGFLGPNGAGKTTTMRLLTGYLSADSGRVEIDGVNVESGKKEMQRIIGYLPENNPLYPEMLVKELMEFYGRLVDLSRDEYRKGLDFVVEAMNIGDVYYRPIKELSKGYKQRVGMAAALLHDPKVVIMDEPTEGLDPNQRSEIRGLIQDLAKKRTIILSTHVMGEAQALANRLVIINRGKLVADGSLDEIARDKKHGVEVEIEGTDVERAIRRVKTIKVNGVKKVGKKNRWVVDLTGVKGGQVQPEIAKLAAKNRWIIWKLVEEERNLEDVFGELTRG